MELRRQAPKLRATGVHREVSPEETLARMGPHLERVGVTRVADITGLDRVGIPVYAAIAPRSQDVLSVYNGKGLTAADARAGAVMEAVERFAAAQPRSPAAVASFAELSRARPTLDPRDCSLELQPGYNEHTRTAWVEGFDLLSEETVLVPLFLAGYYPLGFPWHTVFRLATTNGIAAGNSLEEAVCHALCEVIERDAWTIADLIGHRFSRAVAEGSLPGRGRDPAAAAWFRGRHASIDPHSLPPQPRRLVERFRQAGLAVRLKDITGDSRVPSVLCTVTGDVFESFARTHVGVGTDPDAEVAATRALTEVAQSRAVDIQAVREDISLPDAEVDRALLHVKRNLQADGEGWYGQDSAAPVRLADLPGRPSGDVMEDVRLMLLRLREAGCRRAIAVDLSPAGLPAAVVRVIVPGLESWAVDRSRLGGRATAAWREALRSLAAGAGGA